MNKEISRDTIIQALKNVIDPELKVNVVDLGLIYGVKISDKEVEIEMTLTTPFCPLAPQIQKDIESSISLICDNKIVIKIVWDPPWTTDKMSDDIKDSLGIW